MQNMTWNAGAPAHSTYNNYPTNEQVSRQPDNVHSNIGVVGSGYASRGKAGHIKHLSVGQAAGGICYPENDNVNHTPRTSRSHLLAGLRTVPKSPAPPSSAPYSQQQHPVSQNLSPYNARNNPHLGRDIPQTALGNQFPGLVHDDNNATRGQHMYSTPDQVLAPPALELGYTGGDQYDPQLYDELMATNQWLVQRQQQLQQQLLNVTAAANQFQGLNLSGQTQYATQTTIAAQASMYGQQLQNGLQPVIQPVTDQPGLFSVYNPMTGQYSYFINQTVRNQLPASPAQTPGNGGSPQEMSTPIKAQRNAILSPQPGSPWTLKKPPNVTPPKHTPSPPQDVAPLPPPSANAFRPGHRKGVSVAVNDGGAHDETRDVVGKSFTPVKTPLSNNFGVGKANAGSLPSRQPRGPPPLEELLAAPTALHEGSKNFATRQRRRALHSLVRAGNERLTGRPGSGDVATGLTESESHFGTTDINPSENLLARPSIGSLRAAANGAIGSERKVSKERSRDRTGGIMRPVSARFGSFEETSFANKLMEVKSLPNNSGGSGGDRRRMPMLVLTSAEKRKSTIY